MAKPRGSRSVSAEPFSPADRGEPHEHFSGLAHCPQELGLGEFADVVGYGERAVSARTLGVNHPLGNALAVDVLQFLNQVNILQQRRASGPAVRVFWLSGTGAPEAVSAWGSSMESPYGCVCDGRQFGVGVGEGPID